MNTSAASDDRLESNVLIEKEVPGNSENVSVVMRIPGVDVTVPFPYRDQPGVWFKIDPLFKLTDGSGQFEVIVTEDGREVSKALWQTWPTRGATSFVMDVRTPITGVLIGSYRVTNARPLQVPSLGAMHSHRS